MIKVYYCFQKNLYDIKFHGLRLKFQKKIRVADKRLKNIYGFLLYLHC